jgi:serine protease Do
MRSTRLAGAAAIALVAAAPALILTAPALVAGAADADETAQPGPGRVQAPTPTHTPSYDPSRSLAPLVKAVEPAVAAIEVEGTVRAGPAIPPQLREFFGPMMPDTPPRRMKGEGSGFVISADGLLLTNHHVVDGAETIRARFTDGTVVEAELIGSDASTDVALLQLPDDRTWTHVSLGDSDAVEVGDWVVAVGNPLGLGSTVTAGIVSGKGRNLGDNPYDEFLQTDAAINRGNSGGPLFSLDGAVVGMNTAIIQYANTVGFSVPANVIQRVIDDLRDDGRVSRGYIGVALQPMDRGLATAMGLDEPRGALVTDVQPGLPGAEAGLRSGDVVLEVEGETIDDTADLIRTIGRYQAGEKVRLTLWRDGREKRVGLTLAERPGRKVARAAPAEEDAAPQATPVQSLGLRVAPLTAADADLPQGVRITAVDPAGPAGDRLAAGDVIVKVNRVPITDVAELEQVLGAASGTALFEIRRGEARRFVAVDVPG